MNPGTECRLQLVSSFLLDTHTLFILSTAQYFLNILNEYEYFRCILVEADSPLKKNTVDSLCLKVKNAFTKTVISFGLNLFLFLNVRRATPCLFFSVSLYSLVCSVFV